MKSSETFPVTSPVIQIIFGAVLALGALPAFLFQLSGYTSAENIGITRGSEMASILTAAVLLTLSIAILTWCHCVTADEAAGTITWSRRTLGLSWPYATWRREEIHAIELVPIRGRFPGHRIVARRETGRKLLYERTGGPEPGTIARTIAGSVNKRVTRLEALPRDWWKE